MPTASHRLLRTVTFNKTGCLCHTETAQLVRPASTRKTPVSTHPDPEDPVNPDAQTDARHSRPAAESFTPHPSAALLPHPDAWVGDNDGGSATGSGTSPHEELLGALSVALTRAGIDHSRLRLTRRWLGAPLSATDDRHVVAHAYFEPQHAHLEQQLAAPSRLAQASPEPHQSSGWQPESAGAPLPAIVEASSLNWAVFPQVPTQPNYSDAVPAATAFFASHQLSLLHAEAPDDLSSLFAGRAIPSLENLTRESELRLLALFDTNIARSLSRALDVTHRAVLDALSHTQPRVVLCHGQPSLERFCSTPAGGFFTGFQRTLMAPAEYDLAALRHHLLRIGGNLPAWEAVLAELDDSHRACLEHLDTYENLYAVVATIDATVEHLAKTVAPARLHRIWNQGHSSITWQQLDPTEHLLSRISEVGLLAHGLTLPLRSQRLADPF